MESDPAEPPSKIDEVLVSPPASLRDKRDIIAASIAVLLLLTGIAAALLLMHGAASPVSGLVAPAVLRGYKLVYDDGRGIHVVPLNGAAPFARSDRLPTGTPLATDRSFVFVSGSEAYSITDPFQLPPLPVGPADALFPANHQGNVGLLQNPAPGVAATQVLPIRGTDTATVPAPLPTGYHVIGEVDSGLLLQQIPDGPARVWKAAADGSGQFIATIPEHGPIAAARGDSVAWSDDQACGVIACPMHVTNVLTRVDRIAQPPPGSDGFLFGGTLSPDGRHLAGFASFPPETNVRQQLAVIDLGSMASTVAGPVQVSQNMAAVWTPDSAWVFFCGFPSPLSAYRPSDHRLIDLGVSGACPYFAAF